METTKKFVELLKTYIAKTKEFEPQIKWAGYKELLRDFQREIDKIEQQIKSGELKYKYAHFQYEVLHGKSPNRDVYESLGWSYPELGQIQTQIDDLINPIIKATRNNMESQFELLKNQAKEIMPQIGFSLLKEDKYAINFLDNSGLEILVVDQRYDPPEVWLRNHGNLSAIRLGYNIEVYFDRKVSIWRKYAGEDGRKFNCSSFDYYKEFIEVYKDKILKLGDFVPFLSNWQRIGIQ